MALIISSIFLIVFATQKDFTTFATSTSCNTPMCVKESNRLLKQIDSSVNPCDDFYEFACGKYLRSTEENEEFNYTQSYEQIQNEIIDLYSKPIKQDDHIVVNSAKKLYQACMNTQAIDEDGLKTIKEVLQVMGGGWPLVEGSNWDETKFDWVQATYKLRELGYPFGIFLTVEPKDNDLQVRIPFNIYEVFAILSNRDDAVKNLARVFGADVSRISHEELNNMFQFSEELKEQLREHKGELTYPSYQVSKIQNEMGSINWLEFINKLTNPTISISSDDHVTVVEERSIRSRFQIISKTSKRTQANLFMWKVLEQIVPYLNSEARGQFLSKADQNKPRREFCLETVQKRFIPDPMYAIFAKQHVSQTKKNFVNQIVTDMTNEFLKHLANVQWLSPKDKNIIEGKARNLIVVIGDTENSIDKLLVDMIPIKNETFLNLLAQANRNHMSSRYGKTRKPKKERIYEKWFMEPTYDIVYSYQDNVLRIPTPQLLDEMFNTDKPKYIIYSKLARKIGVQMSFFLKLVTSYYDENVNGVSGWSRESITGFDQESACLIKALKEYKSLMHDFQLYETQSNYFATKLSYEAYKLWIQSNGQEQAPNLDYTPNQLFWISAVKCKRENYSDEDAIVFGSDLRNFTRVSTYATVRDNPNFGADFNCSDNAPMNPSERCHLF